MAEDNKNTLYETPADSGAVQERPDYAAEIREIIRNSTSIDELREHIETYHDNDIAEVLELLTPENRKKLFDALGVQRISEVVSYVEDPERLFEQLDSEAAADILEEMDADDAVDILEDLPDETRENLLRRMDQDSRQDIALIQSFDDEQIGSKMTTNYIEIGESFTIRQAMKSLVSQAANNDNISTLYVIDAEGCFFGAVDLTDLIIARERDSLSSIVTTSYPYVYATETVQECIEELKDYSEDSIPVLDAAHKILGVITAQDIVEVVDEEMGEDYAKLAGLTAEEDLNEPLAQSMKKRIPWLIVLLFLGLIVSSVVGLFETVVQQLTLIVCFQSMVLDMAGNVGTQSLAVTIRVLMDDDLESMHRRKLVWKEIRVGGCIGLVLGVVAFVCIGLFIFIVKRKTLLFAFATSGCVGFALLIAMLVSSFTGTMIPIIFHRMHIDPAVASGPLITTVNDLVAVVTYYGLAWILLINVLHMVS